MLPSPFRMKDWPGVAAQAFFPALGRLGQGDLEFQASLGHVVRPCLKISK